MRRPIAALAALGALCLCAAGGLVIADAASPDAPAEVTGSAPVPAPATPTMSSRFDAVSSSSPPVRVRIPAIGVDSSVVSLGLDGTGALRPPATADVAGWYAAGPAPGATGPAILAGHVDSRSGPGVFFRLVDLRSGDEVLIDRADGSTVTFVVAQTVRTPKAAFPTAQVYAPTPVPELRVITCGGTFNHAIGHYRDNVVVEAVLP